MRRVHTRADEARETATRDSPGDRSSRSEAGVPVEREVLLERAAEDADRLRNDPDDQAEMLAIQRFMGMTD